MPQELSVHAVSLGGMKVEAAAGDHLVRMDYPLAPGEVPAGFTPMQLLLASVAGCGGSTVALLLDKMKQPLEGLEVNASGTRRDEHPTVFTEVRVEFVVRGKVEPDAVERAIKKAEEICPVWAMISGTSLKTSYRINT